MTLIGGASFEIRAEVSQALDAVDKFTHAVSDAFETIRANIGERAFSSFAEEFDKASVAAVATNRALKDLDAVIGQLKAAVRAGFVSEAIQKDIANLERLKDEIRSVSGFSGPALGRRESEQQRRTAFLRETEEAHQAALAKERAFEREAIAARRSIGEQRQLQRALFLQQTREAHEAAISKEQAYQRELVAARKARAEQERLGAELNASINRVNPQLARERQREFDLLVAQASNVQPALDKTSDSLALIAQRGGIAGRAAGALGGVLGKVTGVLGGLGLSVSNVAILLGAGFAGGIAGLIQVGLKFIEVLARMTKAVFEFAKAASILASDMQVLRQNIDDSFGAASEEIQRFAEVAVFAFGVTEREALGLLNTTAQLFQSFGIGEEQAGRMSVQLALVADALRRGQEATVTFEEALKKTRDAVSGNLESLRELGVTLREQDLKDIAEQFDVQAPFDSFEQSMLVVIALVEKAKIELEDAARAPQTLADQFRVTQGAIESVVESIGNSLLPVFQFLGDLVLGVVIGIQSFVNRFQNLVNGIDTFIKKHPLLQKAFEALKNTLVAMFPSLRLMAYLVGIFVDAGEEARTAARAFADELRDLDGLSGDAADALERYRKGLKLTEEELQQLTDAHERVNEAIADNERRVAKAELTLARAYEDARLRIQDAERDLLEAEETRNERIADSEEKLADARVKRFRAIRDAEEKLADARRESAKRVDDAERQLADARRKRQEQIFNALFSLNKALRQGDAEAEFRARLELQEAARKDAVNNAERKLQEEREDRGRELKRLERDLAETIIDENDAVKDAQRDLARVIDETSEQMADAQRRLEAAHRDSQRAIFDARQGLADAMREGTEAIEDAREAMIRLEKRYNRGASAAREAAIQQERYNAALRDYLDALEHFQNNPASGPRPATGSVEILQHGGFAHARRPYIVGEVGPELFIPNQNGTVVSNDQLIRVLRQMVEGGGNGRLPPITVNQVANDPEATAFAVASRVMRGVSR